MDRRSLSRTIVTALTALLALSACAGSDSSNADVPVTVAGAEALGTDTPSADGLGDGANLAVAATPEQLAFFERSTGSVADIARYRAEMWLDATMSIPGTEVSFGSDDPMATMAVADGRTAMTMDLGSMMLSMMENMPSDEGSTGEIIDALEDGTGSWTIEMVVDGSTLYQRQPYLAELFEMEGPDPVPGSLEALLTSADWIRVDASALGIDADALAAQQGGGALELQALADLVSGDDLPVEYLDSSEVRGAPVERYRITTTMGELARLGGGLDPNQYAIPGLDMDDLLDSPIEIVVALDAAGRPVRSEVSTDITINSPAGDFSMSTWQATEYFDFDDPEIAIEIPSDAVDATQQFASMIPSAMLTA